MLRADAVAPAVDRLSEDLDGIRQLRRSRRERRTAGACPGAAPPRARPVLANDPHLPALLPSVWYLAHITTPEWSVAGATLVGGPAVEVGHNGFASWGITAALFDNTDLFQEELGPDGATIRSGDEFVPCEVLTEKIKVRYTKSLTEKVVITPRGPVVSPAFDEGVGALSHQGLLAGRHAGGGVPQGAPNHRLRPVPSVVCPLAGSRSESQLRRLGWSHRLAAGRCGAGPQAGMGHRSTARMGPLGRMGGPAGAVRRHAVPARSRPRVHRHRQHPALPDGGRAVPGRRLDRRLPAGPDHRDAGDRSDWDMVATHALQLDELSIPWRDMRDTVLAAPPANPATRIGLELLGEWDGRVSAGSPGAAVFEFFLAEMARRVARAKAPKSADWVLGKGFAQLMPYTSFSYRRVGHLVQLMNNPPKDDWFGRPWEDEIAAAVEAAVRTLTTLKGEDTAGWAWGKVRPVEIKHPVGEQKPMNKIFNLGPFPWGGDSNTIAQTSVDPMEATNDPGFIASLRFVADVGNWDACEWIIPAGQSGNPLSPHYEDQLPLWREGRGITIAWTPEAVAGATVRTLKLVPKP